MIIIIISYLKPKSYLPQVVENYYWALSTNSGTKLKSMKAERFCHSLLEQPISFSNRQEANNKSKIK